MTTELTSRRGVFEGTRDNHATGARQQVAAAGRGGRCAM